MNHSATRLTLRRPFLMAAMAFFAWIALLCLATKSLAQPASNPLLTLTNVQQVVEFSLERARVEHPSVRVEGGEETTQFIRAAADGRNSTFIP